MHSNEASSLFMIRLFDPAHDLPALVNLINAIDAVDQSGEATTEDQQHAQLDWPGRDLLHDSWVATAAGRADQLIGYGDSWKTPATATADIYVGVHPGWRRRGLGRELLRRTLVRAHEQAAAYVAVYADVNNAASHAFLHNQGFQVAGAFVELYLALPDTIETPQWPAGYALRRLSEAPDLPGLVNILNQSYGDRFGHKITTEIEIESWLALETAGNILLLFDASETAIGICRVRPTTSTQGDIAGRIGYLDAPGVVPTHRQSGLYRSLVLAGMELLCQQGQTAIVFESWGDEERIIADYCGLGFRRQRHFMAYQHVL